MPKPRLFALAALLLLSGLRALAQAQAPTPDPNEIRRFEGHRYEVTAVAWSPDGRFALTAGQDTIILWNAETGQEVRRCAGHFNVSSVAFSPDGRFILSGSKDHFMRLWDAATGEDVHRFAQ